jgi:hypothetical protein
METQIVETDSLAAFRGIAPEPKKMSDKAAARLREVNEQDRLNRLSNAALVKWFNETPKTVETLMDVLYRISDRRRNIRQRAIKCFYMLARGNKIQDVHGVSFFGVLLPEEESMSVLQILKRYPIDEEKTLQLLPEAPPVRLCALGRKCFRAHKSKAAEITGTGAYCSKICKGAAQAAKRRSKALAPAVI